MKITRDTPALLTASEVPWFMAIMLSFFILVFAGVGILVMPESAIAGLVFLVVGGGLGLGAMAVFVERLQLVLNASSGEARVSARTIFRSREAICPLHDVIRAEVETTLSSNSGNSGSTSRHRLSRLVLIVRDGSGTGRTAPQPVTQVFSSGTSAATIARHVNEWLKENRGVDSLDD